jgi:hypothetical protein
VKTSYGTKVATMETYLRWMTDARLARWNHIRKRAGATPVTKEEAAHILFKASPEARVEIMSMVLEAK